LKVVVFAKRSVLVQLEKSGSKISTQQSRISRE
jgi:hypothetical protein